MRVAALLVFIAPLAWLAKLTLEREYRHVAPKLARRLVHLAVRIAPPSERQRYREEWLAEVDEAEAADDEATGLAWSLGLPFAGLLYRWRAVVAAVAIADKLACARVAVALTWPVVAFVGRGPRVMLPWGLSVVAVFAAAALRAPANPPYVFWPVALATTIGRAAVGAAMTEAVVSALAAAAAAETLTRLASMAERRFGSLAAGQVTTLCMMMLMGATQDEQWQWGDAVSAFRWAGTYIAMTAPPLVGLVLTYRSGRRWAQGGAAFGAFAYAAVSLTLKGPSPWSIGMLALWPAAWMMISAQALDAKEGLLPQRWLPRHAE